MNPEIPDFYMTSSESHQFRQLRKCYSIKRFHANKRDDYLLIRISPPLEVPEHGIAGNQISELIIATHDKGVSLFPVTKWPVRVYVLQPLIEKPEERDILKDDEMILIGWAEIYDSQLKIY